MIIHLKSRLKTTHNKRVCGSCYQSISFESNDSNFGLFAFSWDRSDPAAHAKH